MFLKQLFPSAFIASFLFDMPTFPHQTSVETFLFNFSVFYLIYGISLLFIRRKLQKMHIEVLMSSSEKR